MQHNRMLPYLFGAASVAAILIGFGVPFASLLLFAVLLACPLMMVFMMRGMAVSHRHDNHTGHGCEHAPTGQVEDQHPR